MIFQQTIIMCVRACAVYSIYHRSCFCLLYVGPFFSVKVNAMPRVREKEKQNKFSIQFEQNTKHNQTQATRNEDIQHSKSIKTTFFFLDSKFQLNIIFLDKLILIIIINEWFLFVVFFFKVSESRKYFFNIFAFSSLFCSLSGESIGCCFSFKKPANNGTATEKWLFRNWTS